MITPHGASSQRSGALVAGVVLLAMLVPSPGETRADDAHSAGARPETARVTKETSGTKSSVLQMNLCNSGQASCYAGGAAIDEAIDRIQRTEPDVVTLNEVCRDDVARIAEETARLPVFHPVGDGNDNPVTCTNGADYGMGVVGGSAGHGTPETDRGWYTEQDAGEQRGYLCATFGRNTACTTHLSVNAEVARAQCQGDEWPLRGKHAERIVLGGDLNLRDEETPSARDCVPRGFFHEGDAAEGEPLGGLQHIIASSTNFDYAGHETLPMKHTDHPALVMRLRTT